MSTRSMGQYLHLVLLTPFKNTSSSVFQLAANLGVGMLQRFLSLDNGNERPLYIKIKILQVVKF